MAQSEPGAAAAPGTHSRAPRSSSAGREPRATPAHPGGIAPLGITVYGCGPDEAVLFRAMAPRFGIVPTITAAAVCNATLHLASGHRCISVGHKTQITNGNLTALSRAGVQYISTRSIGYNHIDVTHAASVGILVENVSYSPASVADYTVMLMLMALRNTKSILLQTARHDYRLCEAPGKELRDMTVGVIGTGRIGAAVVDRLRGFGCGILAYDHRPKIGVEYVSIEELLHQSDIVTLHVPLNADTYHLLNRERVQQMKHGAVIVNTGRGPLLDTEAVIAALESGDVGGAAFDVLEGEEGIFYTDCTSRPPENELLLRLQRLANVTITPHTAYHTDRALSDAVAASIRNCLTFLNGGQTCVG